MKVGFIFLVDGERCMNQLGIPAVGCDGMLQQQDGELGEQGVGRGCEEITTDVAVLIQIQM